MYAPHSIDVYTTPVILRHQETLCTANSVLIGRPFIFVNVALKFCEPVFHTSISRNLFSLVGLVNVLYQILLLQYKNDLSMSVPIASSHWTSNLQSSISSLVPRPHQKKFGRGLGTRLLYSTQTICCCLLECMINAGKDTRTIPFTRTPFCMFHWSHSQA